MTKNYPGSPQHQAVLAAFVAHYRDDPRILALTVFGSLGRGDWDERSDLDLDVVVRDGVEIDVLPEVTTLCAACAAHGEVPALILSDKPDAADVVFESLLELSVRYHPLAATSPNIVESLVLLHGSMPLEAIQEAGRKNARTPPSSEALSGEAMRQMLAADRALRRGHFWQTVAALERVRSLLAEIAAQERGQPRPYHALDDNPNSDLYKDLRATLPQPNFTSLQAALLRLRDIAEGQSALTERHRQILDEIRRRHS